MINRKSIPDPTVSIPAQTSRPDRTTLAAFAVFVIVSGGASVAIRFTYAELAPYWGAAVRFALGALFFWGLAAYKRVEIPKGRALTGAVLYGALAATWLAFGYIVVFVTVIAFFLYLFVLGRWTASGTSYGFVLIPLITVVLATTLAGERITAGFIGGAVLVLLGVWFGALLPATRRR